MTFPLTDDLILIQVRANRKPHDYRCKKCGRLLFRAAFVPGSYIEIRCFFRKCYTMNVFEYPANGNGKGD